MQKAWIFVVSHRYTLNARRVRLLLSLVEVYSHSIAGPHLTERKQWVTGAISWFVTALQESNSLTSKFTWLTYKKSNRYRLPTYKLCNCGVNLHCRTVRRLLRLDLAMLGAYEHEINDRFSDKIIMPGGIRQINHVFLPITKYLPSIAFLGAPNFPQISIKCSAHSIPGRVPQA